MSHEHIRADLVAYLRSLPTLRNNWLYAPYARLWRMVWP